MSSSVVAQPVSPSDTPIRYNDWHSVEHCLERLSSDDTFVPCVGVSVAIPYFETPQTLALVLAGLEAQNWPSNLLEAIVVADGSCPPLAGQDSPLNLNIVRLEDRGFGPARAHNAGVRVASHDILIFLAADIVVHPDFVAAHARWHHARSDVVTIGYCRDVPAADIDTGTLRAMGAPAMFSNRSCNPPRNDYPFAATADSTAWRPDLFPVLNGGSFAVRRSFFDELGGFDESFDRYGGEDTELGYRAQARGALLVPVRGAMGWHLGPWRNGRPPRAADSEIQRNKLADLIPLPEFRCPVPGRSYAVPRHVVTIEAGDSSPARILQTIEDVLADPPGDLVVFVMLPPGFPSQGLTVLHTRFDSDFRVRIASVISSFRVFPVSAIQIVMPAGAPRYRGLVGVLVEALNGHVEVTAVLDRGFRATATLGWSLHRARRSGGTPGDYGDTAIVRLASDDSNVPPLVHSWCREGVQRFRTLLVGHPGRGVNRVWEELRHVRGGRTTWRFLCWFTGALLWRLRRLVGATLSLPSVIYGRLCMRRPATSVPNPVSLGIEIAVLGPGARAVFAATPRVMRGLSQVTVDRHVDAVLADTVLEAREATAVGIPVALLSGGGDSSVSPSLAVPAFNAECWNPRGWTSNVEDIVGALGPPELLPAGVVAHRQVASGALSPLRSLHHVEDIAAFHANPVERAGVLARLAGAGVLVRLADSASSDAHALSPLLGADLYSLMASGVRGVGWRERESISIRMRRAALRDHTLPVRARQVAEAAGIKDLPQPLLVSVLLVTRRPYFLDAALANVARQNWPRIELVLALHGSGFGDERSLRRIAGLNDNFPHSVRLLRFDSGVAFGTVLNAASESASGTLLGKMDDDDFYGPHHILDLVLAHRYSGADLVGKYRSAVYLARSDRTVRCRWSPNEIHSRTISGGTMLLSRSALDRAGGWRRLPRHVDLALIEDVRHAGGTIYRTHDEGYVQVRHGQSHTWRVEDEHFLGQAHEVRSGWHPEFAGIGQDVDSAPFLQALAWADSA